MYTVLCEIGDSQQQQLWLQKNASRVHEENRVVDLTWPAAAS